MGLRCSLLGHDFGDSEVRQEREERGSEVLVTVQEVETCARCGTERVTSENKEVTSIGTPPERPDPTGDPGAAGPESDPTMDRPPAESATGDAPAGAEAGDASAAPDPTEEDAEIIDADGDADPSPASAAGADDTAADAGAAGADAAGADAVPIREVEAGEQATLDDAAAGASSVDDATSSVDDATSSVDDATSSADDSTSRADDATVAADEGADAGSDSPDDGAGGWPDPEADRAADETAAAGARDAEAEPAPDRDREPGDWPTGPDRSDDDYDPSRGRWPERGDPPRPVHGEGDADAPWPEVDEGADEGYDAEVGGETPDDVEFGGGLTPERRGGEDLDDAETIGPDAGSDPEAAADPDDAEFLDDTELNEQSEASAETVDPADLEAAAREAGADEERAVDELLEKTAEPPSDDGGTGGTAAGDTGFARPAGSADRDRPGRRRTEPLGQLESPVTEYHCPECGYTEESATSSLRAGDICPECRRGYLGERDA